MAWLESLTRAEWIAIAAVAISLASSTAAWSMFRLSRRDRKIDAPTARHHAYRHGEYLDVTFEVEDHHADTWQICKLQALQPPGLRIGEAKYEGDGGGGHRISGLGALTRSYLPTLPSKAIRVGMVALESPTITLRVTFVARAAPYIKSRLAIVIPVPKAPQIMTGIRKIRNPGRK